MDIRASADDGNKSTGLVVLGLDSYNRWQIDFAVFIGGITMPNTRELQVKTICKMSGKETSLPCSASGCPLFGDCLVIYQKYAKKAQTNADRIRAMSDEGLARFLAAKSADAHLNTLEQALTAIQIESLRSTWYHAWKQWLKQPAEE